MVGRAGRDLTVAEPAEHIAGLVVFNELAHDGRRGPHGRAFFFGGLPPRSADRTTTFCFRPSPRRSTTSARNLPFPAEHRPLGGDWIRARNRPTFLPTGPFLVPTELLGTTGNWRSPSISTGSASSPTSRRTCSSTSKRSVRSATLASRSPDEPAGRRRSPTGSTPSCSPTAAGRRGSVR
ncbi:fumarylacetoacetate hydrolase family protein [Saccharopolyspora dendranthemae]|uniref:fumarylacetoacetate hydrolase family protein n=1 Tax=Saccharopolyspora dendranthemae TaxID=1181886 RepID=UPI00164670FD